MLELIKNLASAEYLASRLGQVCDSVARKKNGNIIGHIKGTSDKAPLMLATHTDLPHFLCMSVDGEKVSLQYVGNFKGDKWENCNVVSECGAKGVISEEDDKITATVDVTSDKVSVGDVFFVDSSPITEYDSILLHGISTLAPVASLLLTAEKIWSIRPARDVYFAFTAEGQYGYKLYADDARKCDAAEVICIGAVDEEVSETVAVRLCDRSFSSDKALSDTLVSCGAAPMALRESRCAASTVQLWGIPSAQLDLPVKDIGTIKESLKEPSIHELVRILADFCNK